MSYACDCRIGRQRDPFGKQLELLERAAEQAGGLPLADGLEVAARVLGLVWAVEQGGVADPDGAGAIWRRR